MYVVSRLVRATIVALTMSFLATPLFASDSEVAKLSDTVQTLERTLGARIGVYVLDSETEWTWSHRQTERFLMASTFKTPLCGAVLDRLEGTSATLDDPLPITQADILHYAPVTEKHVGGTLSIGALCFATLDQSDNTAANILLRWLGGPGAVTQFLRETGDAVTQLDRYEPDLNIFAAGDPRDTTSPEAMVGTWHAMLAGDALLETSRQQLEHWMQSGGVTGGLLRPSVPVDWAVSDKSGGGRHHTRNLVAMITPPGRAPYFAAIYISDTDADWPTRNQAVAKIGAAVMAVIQAR